MRTIAFRRKFECVSPSVAEVARLPVFGVRSPRRNSCEFRYKTEWPQYALLNPDLPFKLHGMEGRRVPQFPPQSAAPKVRKMELTPPHAGRNPTRKRGIGRSRIDFHRNSLAYASGYD